MKEFFTLVLDPELLSLRLTNFGIVLSIGEKNKSVSMYI